MTEQTEQKHATHTHTIRAQDGGLVEVKHYAPRRAIKAFCTECLGWQGNPKNDCTSPNCPLHPFRGRAMVAWRSHALCQAPESPSFLKKGEPEGVECPESRHGYQNGHGDADAPSHPANPRVSAGEDDNEMLERQQLQPMANQITGSDDIQIT